MPTVFDDIVTACHNFFTANIQLYFFVPPAVYSQLSVCFQDTGRTAFRQSLPVDTTAADKHGQDIIRPRKSVSGLRVAVYDRKVRPFPRFKCSAGILFKGDPGRVDGIQGQGFVEGEPFGLGGDGSLPRQYPGRDPARVTGLVAAAGDKHPGSNVRFKRVSPENPLSNERAIAAEVHTLTDRYQHGLHTGGNAEPGGSLDLTGGRHLEMLDAEPVVESGTAGQEFFPRF